MRFRHRESKLCIAPILVAAAIRAEIPYGGVLLFHLGEIPTKRMSTTKQAFCRETLGLPSDCLVIWFEYIVAMKECNFI